MMDDTPAVILEIMTEELDAKLRALTARQVQAIWQIIEAGHFVETPIITRKLIYGPAPICTADTFYARGKWSDKQHKWTKPPGWRWQPAFMDALNLAKRLASIKYTSDQLTKARQVSDKALDGAPTVMQHMIDIATDQAIGEDGKYDPRSVPAAALVFKYAGLDRADALDSPVDSAEADWWRAMEDD